MMGLGIRYGCACGQIAAPPAGGPGGPGGPGGGGPGGPGGPGGGGPDGPGGPFQPKSPPVPEETDECVRFDPIAKLALLSPVVDGKVDALDGVVVGPVVTVVVVVP